MKMFILTIVAFQLAACNELFELDKMWVEHKKAHSLIYRTEEEVKRKIIFKNNLDFINRINNQDLGFELAMNMFGHMTEEEMNSLNIPFPEYTPENDEVEAVSGPPLVDAPDIDWRDFGAVTPVKNQGGCGSCYAFGAVGALEGVHKIKNGKLVAFSEQQMVDCTYGGKYRNGACRGGSSEFCFNYVKDFGVMSEADYPYKFRQGNCMYNKSKAIFWINSHRVVQKANETEISYIIYKSGPLATGIRTSKELFFYKKGTLNVTDCSQTPNHALVAVGIGSNPKHYIVKNSWGKGWGANGFGNVSRYNRNMCGIASHANYVIL